MKKFALALMLYIPPILFAQEDLNTTSTKKHTATIEPLKEPNAALVCAACHGPQGNSSNPTWPNIAGQHPKYFIKQLNDMKDRSLRNAPVMSALVETLSDQQMNDLAVYYARMPLAQNSTPERALKRGEQLYRRGDFAQKITACIACHGPTGKGNAQAGFPVLSGQHAAYTVLQLHAFKNNSRKNDLNDMMQSISNRMSQDDMEAVAHYIESLH